MGIESGTYINDLVATNPIGASDPISDGDNHIRLIKSIIKATFPGMGGAAWRIQSKSGNYTVLATDNMSVIRCTAGLTLTLTAASTLGNGHMFYVFNDSTTGLVTIDANGSELIGGSPIAYVLREEFAAIFCDSTGFHFMPITSLELDNPIINGDMQIYGRGIGTATSSGTVARYLPDRTLWSQIGASAQVMLTTTGVSIPLAPIDRAFKVTNQRVKAQASSDFCMFNHIVEGNRWLPFFPNPFTVSFWIKSSLTGTYSLSLINNGANQSFRKAFQISSVNTFELKTFRVPSCPGGAGWDFSNTVGISLRVCLGTGSTFIGSNDDSWTAANNLAATAVTNFLGTLSASCAITGINISPGFAPRIFKARNRTLENLLCLRYFNCTIEQDFAAVSAGSGLTGAISIACVGQAGPTIFPYRHPVPMRIKPVTTTIMNPAGFNNKARNTTRSIDSNTAVLAAQSKVDTVFSVAPTTSDSAGDLMMLHAAFDSEF
jgi:hypothetical protein